MSRRALIPWALLLVFLLLVACRSTTSQNGQSAAIPTSGANSGQDDDAVGGATATTSGGGYASKVSVAPGESLSFHISNSFNAPYTLTIYREGMARQLMATIPNVQTEDYSLSLIHI